MNPLSSSYANKNSALRRVTDTTWRAWQPILRPAGEGNRAEMFVVTDNMRTAWHP